MLNEKHVTCSYGCKLESLDNKISISFESYLDEYALYWLFYFISSMIEEIKYCSDVVILVMTKKDN